MAEGKLWMKSALSPRLRPPALAATAGQLRAPLPVAGARRSAAESPPPAALRQRSPPPPLPPVSEGPPSRWHAAPPARAAGAPVCGLVVAALNHVAIQCPHSSSQFVELDPRFQVALDAFNHIIPGLQAGALIQTALLQTHRF